MIHYNLCPCAIFLINLINLCHVATICDFVSGPSLTSLPIQFHFSNFSKNWTYIQNLYLMFKIHSKFQNALPNSKLCHLQTRFQFPKSLFPRLPKSSRISKFNFSISQPPHVNTRLHNFTQPTISYFFFIIATFSLLIFQNVNQFKIYNLQTIHPKPQLQIWI